MSNPYLKKLLRKVAIAVQAVEDHRLPILARLVFVELLFGFHNTGDGRCDPAAAAIGKAIGRHERNVRTAIAELEAAGVVRSRQRGPTSSEYSFPGLSALDEHPQDRAILPGLGGKDRAVLPARPGDSVLQDRAILPDKPLKRTSKENLGTPQRGTRLQEDWKPSEADVDFAGGYGLTTPQIEFEATKFRNYWLAKAGRDFIKASWSRTWQNWILNTGKCGVAKDGRPPSSNPAATDWDLHVGQYRANGKWLPILGPAPDYAGCKAPVDVLRRHGFIREARAES